MTELAKGTVVRLTSGTRVGIDSGERFDWGGRKYDWHVVGPSDDPDDDLHSVAFEVLSAGPSHATMNGGGRDYDLICLASGLVATVRTTFQRGENKTFIPEFAREIL